MKNNNIIIGSIGGTLFQFYNANAKGQTVPPTNAFILFIEL